MFDGFDHLGTSQGVNGRLLRALQGKANLISGVLHVPTFLEGAKSAVRVAGVGQAGRWLAGASGLLSAGSERGGYALRPRVSVRKRPW